MEPALSFPIEPSGFKHGLDGRFPCGNKYAQRVVGVYGPV